MNADYASILVTFEHARAEQPALAPLIALHRALWDTARAIAAAPTAPASPDLVAHIMQGLERGTAIIATSAWRPAPTPLAARWENVCAILAEHHPDLAASLDAMARLSETQIAAFADAYLAHQISAPDQFDAALVNVVLNHTLRPFLHAEAVRWQTPLREVKWYLGTCPFCGGAPDFAALVKGDARRLLCSRCDGEWDYSRVGCPFCGANADSYFEDTNYRLYVCEQCRHYLKTLDARKLDALPLLPVERVLTLGMDLAAHERGYLGV